MTVAYGVLSEKPNGDTAVSAKHLAKQAIKAQQRLKLAAMAFVATDSLSVSACGVAVLDEVVEFLGIFAQEAEELGQIDSVYTSKGIDGPQQATPEECELVDLFRKLPQDKQQIFLIILRDCAAQEGE